jgi:hypothetical protein
VRLGPRVDARVEFGARRAEGEDAEPRGVRRRGGARVSLRGEGDPGLQADFEGTLGARPVARLNPRGGQRVETFEEAVEVLGPAPLPESDETEA